MIALHESPFTTRNSYLLCEPEQELQNSFRRGTLHPIRGRQGPPRSCPRCGTYVTRSVLGRWSCADCGWKGLTPAPYRIIYLDPGREYACPRCHNVVKPKVEETIGGVPDQSCPKCH